MDNKEHFKALVDSVGQWSVYNFGNQNGLEQLAPLLGMIEELGEYYASTTSDDALDAKCDFFIYFCDYLYRSGDEFYLNNELEFSLSNSKLGEKEIILNIFLALSKICHIELKRMQGIRKFANDAFYHSEKKQAIRKLYRRFARGHRDLVRWGMALTSFPLDSLTYV